MTRHRALRLLPLSCLLALFAGCGGGEGGIDTGPSTSPDASIDPSLDAADPSIDAHDPSADAASAATTRTTIGAAGGVARSADGSFEIHVAPGALTEDTELAIRLVPPSEVPADIAATGPLTPVYAVEPDGLVFAGDGAIARFALAAVPPALVEGDARSALLGATRTAAPGPIEDEAASTTIYTAAGGVVVYVPLTHLSFKWAFERSLAGDRFAVGTVVGAPRQEVGDSWAWTLVAEGERPFAQLESVSWSREPSVISVRTGPPWSEDRVILVSSDPGIGPIPWAPATPVPSRQVRVTPPMGFPAGELQRFRPGPTFRCEATGSALTATAVYFSGRGLEDSVSVVVEQEVECVPPVGVEVSILDTIPAIRDNLAILTDTAPLAEVRVETRREGTRTVSLGGGTWSATLEPARGAVAVGPATITAENAGGATMTATRDASTGEYTALVDDPSLWDPSVSTQVTFGALPRSEIRPVPPFGVTFGPVSDLDTPMTLEADTRLAIRIPGELRCGVEDVLDLTVFRDIVDSFPLAGPLREGLALLADHCGVAIDALTARPFSVEISRRQRALAVMPDTASVEVGRAITLDGASLLATCGAARPTFCFDRCVDTMADPMNCGGCGLVGTEVCDGVDNDCDYTRDEECPIGIAWSGGGDRDSSGMIGDVTSASFGSYGDSCPYFSPFLGFCGTANGDGTVRAFNAICGDVAWERTGPDVFTLTVTEAPHAGGIFCEGGTFSPSGGMVISARCPAGMIADGVTGMAPSMGHIGQIGATCSRWGVVRHPTHGWVLQRLERGTSTTIGTGAGMPFSFMLADDPVTGAPGALRQLSVRYRSTAPGGMPGGALWFSVAGSPQILDF